MRPVSLAAAFCALWTTCACAQIPAPSDELNKELPKWLRFSGEYRTRFEGFTGAGFKSNSDDAYMLSRLRLNMTVRPSSWLRFSFQGQDARVFGKNQTPAAPPYQNTFDIRIAYAELGDSEKGIFGVRVGRQELNFGEQRLVGSANWLNTARSFDAVRATLRYGRYRLDAFSASVVNAKDGEWDHHQQGNNLHGLYGGIDKVIPNGTIEPYVLWRIGPGGIDRKTFGGRVAGKAPNGFDYSVEMLRQTQTDAWAGHWLAGYTVAPLKYKPRLIAEFNYGSPTFDQLYPTGHDKWGLADQVGWHNIRDLRTGVEIKPRPKWTASAIFNDWWLADSKTALYSAAGTAVARVAAGNAGDHVGEEFDLQAGYAMSKQLQFAMGFGHVFPGEFLKAATPGKAYNFPYFMATWAF